MIVTGEFTFSNAVTGDPKAIAQLGRVKGNVSLVEMINTKFITIGFPTLQLWITSGVRPSSTINLADLSYGRLLRWAGEWDTPRGSVITDSKVWLPGFTDGPGDQLPWDAWLTVTAPDGDYFGVAVANIPRILFRVGFGRLG